MSKHTYLLTALLLGLIMLFTGCSRKEDPTAPVLTQKDEGKHLLQKSGTSVTVFSTDFNTGVPTEFSGVTTTEGVQGYAGLGTGLDVFGGDFLRNSTAPPSNTTLTLTGLQPHASISLGFLLAIIDSWDGNGIGDPNPFSSPDFLNVRIDGVTIFSHRLSNQSSVQQDYVPPPGVELAYRLDFGFSTGIYYFDSAYNMGLDATFQNIPHTSSTLTIEWFASGGGWSGGSDESWAIDNVEVRLNDTDGKVTICHKPGTPAQKTLVIPVQALAGHLGHGDTIGPCE